ncbi:hypothetical protein SAMN05518801_12535 [Novosphingobium sp. CF614]|nr:hypothetical protein SAMN05518801_12535 [Novosphingobium sp. CF614]
MTNRARLATGGPDLRVEVGNGLPAHISYS